MELQTNFAPEFLCRYLCEFCFRLALIGAARQPVSRTVDAATAAVQDKTAVRVIDRPQFTACLRAGGWTTFLQMGRSRKKKRLRPRKTITTSNRDGIPVLAASWPPERW